MTIFKPKASSREGVPPQETLFFKGGSKVPLVKRLLTFQVKGPLAFVTTFLLGLVTVSSFYLGIHVSSSRFQVSDPSASSSLGILFVGNYQCSAFRVGPASFVSAAHCFLGTQGEPASVLMAPFSFAGTSSSGPTCMVVDKRIPPAFHSARDTSWDYALVTVDASCSSFFAGPYYKLSLFDSSSSYEAYGYPGNEAPSSLWVSYGHVHHSVLDILSPGNSKHAALDIKATPGFSGSVVTSSSSELLAYGVVSSNRGDGACLISTFDDEKLAQLRLWLSESDPRSTNASVT